VLECPAKFAWRRERVDCSDEGANLGGGECTNDPFRAVGDQQRDAIASLDSDGKERPGEVIHPRLEAGVIETLVAKDEGLGVGCGGSHLVDQIAQCPAGRTTAR
jgi:hypothetical protein